MLAITIKLTIHCKVVEAPPAGEGNLSDGAIAGIVVGSVVVVLTIAASIVAVVALKVSQGQKVGTTTGSQQRATVAVNG